MEQKVLKRMKKFRFQLLHQWIVQNYTAGKMADIGGGKGLLAYLLAQDGWDATVIDPEYQPLPAKYKTLDKKRMKIDNGVEVKHITQAFEPSLAKDFDLLVGLHAHGSNLRIIDAASTYKCNFILLPCCIIDEGIDPYSVTDWLAYIENYAQSKGIKTERVKLNFKGQRSAIFSVNI